MLGMSVPMAWFYIKSVEYFVSAFNGQIWQSRFIGFSIGIAIFAIMSYVLFSEPMTYKTIISVLLAFAIIAVQIFLK